MQNDWLSHSYIAKLNPYDVDKNFKAGIPGINQLVDRAAFDHIEKLGFATKRMLERKLAWVLFQKDFHILEEPSLNTEYSIHTQITGRDRMFTYRDFRIHTPGTKNCVTISSAWLLFDLESRHLIRKYPEGIDAIVLPGNSIDSLPRPVRLSNPQVESFDKKEEFTIGFLELDSTGHASNQDLIRRMIGVLPYRHLDEQMIKSFKVQFRTEARLEDDIDILRNNTGNNQWTVACVKDGQVIAFSEILFAERH